ncbi:fumarylacetoacetate hydrolase family protein [Kutzneria sp. NPDC052558]|uniref:fumarylacetoacetate hydrolase family protein n=1 Tax=Kutzneria sp. NPDC052558 TaxID=3364121 RepID=UPI0037CB49AC
MRLVSFGEPGQEQPGVLRDDKTIVALRALLERHAPGTAPDMITVLARFSLLRKHIADLIAAPDAPTVATESVRIGPPVPNPGAIVAVGANYLDHLREITGPATEQPADPVLFLKPASSLSGPHDPVVRPRESKGLDYECELAVVIGRGGRRIPANRALDHAAGYMIANDVTARDLMAKDIDKGPLFTQILRGKGCDTFCPTGPWLLTTDGVPDLAALRLRTWVNDELRQDAFAAQMVATTAQLIASVSDCMTLNPGDIILTGTPGGVGSKRQPPSFLEPGDRLRLEITGLGRMQTPVESEL